MYVCVAAERWEGGVKMPTIDCAALYSEEVMIHTAAKVKGTMWISVCILHMII